MRQWLGRAALWVLAVGFVSIGAGLIHLAVTGWQQSPVEAFPGMAFLLTGAAVWWHKLRLTF
ncbi:hypothetical protein [Methylobacterium gregans]|uniref:Uncharacterized protein n=1 Tax=Methylobacterium gregans TaxID=374424 RepID=A0AA37MBH2_9HYPH|nr:hypothetical protein [Methylobacterium gregans]MDQ0520006.1 hypothetical protein [Methylobacterium gregans]GJD78839.1 hypothetical protein NBEOAGPD_2058 [Methylobacterium gregans]GLS53873.1 hypothetical protein GCM10007886_20560 [Methylobacterium gregans]